jgi:hypothetical protein
MFLVLSQLREGPPAIEALDALRDVAFEPKLGGGLKELGAIAIDMVAELDRRPGIRLDQSPESRPSLDERRFPQILAIEVEKVEGKKQYPMRRFING